MNGILKTLITLFFGSNYGYFTFVYVFYIVGLWFMFKKSGIKSWWALVPCFREYQLAKCAGNVRAGRVLFALDVLGTIFNLVEERIQIASFSMPAEVLLLALVTVRIIYDIRVCKDLADVYEVKRIWVLPWVLIEWLVAMIWGLSKKFQPYANAEVAAADWESARTVRVQEMHQEIHTWFSDLKANLKRAFGFFAFGGDWKCLPIAILITAIVASIARTDFFTSMDGTVKGSLALTCIAIWNGCFNSILVVSREKKEVRARYKAGMKLSTYIISVFLYQFAICLVQTVLSIYTCRMVGIRFPSVGLFGLPLMVEIGITMFLITLAADMLSLTISALVTDSIAAMTIMPFVLVIQLVFSGSVINVSTWNHSISRYTISNYGVKCIAAQADYNERPMMLAWNSLQSIRHNKVGTVVNVGKVMDMLQDESSPAIMELRSTKVGDLFSMEDIKKTVEENKSLNALLDRDLGIDLTVGDIIDKINDEERFPALKELKQKEISKTFTGGEIKDLVSKADAFKSMKDKKIIMGLFTVGSVIDIIFDFVKDKEFTIKINVGDVLDKALTMDAVVALREKKPFEGLTLRKILAVSGLGRMVENLGTKYDDSQITVGELIDTVLSHVEVQKLRNVDIDFTTTIDEIIKKVGEERVKSFLIENASDAAMVEEYRHTRENVAHYWRMIGLFVLLFAFTSTASIIVGTRWGNRKEKKA